MSIIITVVTNILCVKEFVFGVILVRIFPAFSRIRTEYEEILRIFLRSDRGENGMATTTKEEQFFITHEETDIRFFFFSSQLCSTRKHSYYIISIMLYQKTQLLCELISPTLC